MLTWKLWRALRHPPYHNPVFRRVRGSADLSNRFRQIAILIFGYFSFCMVFSLMWPYLFNAPSFTLALVVGAANTIYGMMWAGGISAAIAHERELKTYDLLCVQPSGALGIDWALSTATQHRSPLFRDLPALLQMFVIAFIGALGIVGLCTSLMAVSEMTEESLNLLTASVQGIALTAVFYFDHVQSLVLANIVGMTIPRLMTDRLNARVGAVGLFLLCKVTLYAVILIVQAGVLPVLLNPIAIDESVKGMAAALILLAVFYQLHEQTIQTLWKRFVQYHTSGETLLMVR